LNIILLLVASLGFFSSFFVFVEIVQARFQGSGWYPGVIEGFEEPGEHSLMGGYVILFNAGKRVRNVQETRIKKVKSQQIKRWGIPWNECD
jgi:hypothetical protein